jgi:pimeloyl-[acyl-carrier protein] methyl ester esterase
MSRGLRLKGRGHFSEAEAAVFALYGLRTRQRLLDLPEAGIRLRVVETGSGAPTLLLHGFSLATAHWAPLMARLPGRRLIALDMPGHGASDGKRFDNTDLRAWFDTTLTALLTELDLDSVDVIGHSQGAMLGMFLALDHPERVRQLITIGTPAVAFGAALSSLRILARPRLGPLLLDMPKPGTLYRKILSNTVGSAAVAAMPDELIRATYLANRRPGFGTTVSSYLREMFRGTDADPPRYVLSDTELRRLTPPVTVILGHVEATKTAAQRVALIPQARLQPVPGEHEPWFNDLDSCAARITNALEAA